MEDEDFYLNFLVKLKMKKKVEYVWLEIFAIISEGMGQSMKMKNVGISGCIVQRLRSAR